MTCVTCNANENQKAVEKSFRGEYFNIKTYSEKDEQQKIKSCRKTSFIIKEEW